MGGVPAGATGEGSAKCREGGHAASEGTDGVQSGANGDALPMGEHLPTGSGGWVVGACCVAVVVGALWGHWDGRILMG